MRPWFVWAAICAFAFTSFAADDFYSAIRRDDFTTVNKLLASDGPNAKDSRGNTPLMDAAAVGSEAMMRRLIDAGADVNATNALDAGALHWCAANLARARLLVEHGAGVNTRSKQGHTPAFIAASEAGGLPALEYLVSKGAALAGPPDALGNTPLSIAAWAGDVAMVKFIVEKGGPAALAPPGGPHALINAAALGNLEIVKLLLAKGIDVNSVSPPPDKQVKNGVVALGSFTALLLASAAGDTETVRALLDAGANVNAQDARGMTPLMLAVASDHPNRDIIRLLLDKGADTKWKSKAGETALDWAVKFKQPAIVAAVRAASPGVETADRQMPAPPRARFTTAQASLEKSIPLLQSAAATAFREGGCVSCHNGNAVTSAVAAVRAKGIAVDEKGAAEIVHSTRRDVFTGPEALLERVDPPAIEILLEALAALGDENTPPDRRIDAMVRSVAAQQLGPGYWAHTAVVRPPTADGLFSSSAYAIRAFSRYAPPARKAEYEERIARAARALSAAEPSTTEDTLMQMLGLKWAGADPARIERLKKSVLALQRKDGGWGQTPLLATDAYATGSALHALFECGLSPQSPEYRKGVAFLLATQAADGSWHITSRAPKFQPYFEGGFPYGHDQWISAWGTSWATIALAHALPDRRAAAR